MRIRMEDGKLIVPDNPEIVYIEGDGVGQEITDKMRHVLDAAIAKAYEGKRRIEWKEALAGGKADAFLNGLSIQQDRDLPSFTLMNGSFSKRVGDGKGNVRRINYTLLGGTFRQNVDAQENLTGDTEQGTALYRMTFAQGARAIV